MYSKQTKNYCYCCYCINVYTIHSKFTTQFIERHFCWKCVFVFVCTTRCDINAKCEFFATHYKQAYIDTYRINQMKILCHVIKKKKKTIVIGNMVVQKAQTFNVFFFISSMFLGRKNQIGANFYRYDRLLHEVQSIYN